jgi:uncharacterized membrane protein YphA (DoxX/SURF4 family)
MIQLTKAGRLFFSLGIIAYGLQQIIIRDFRPQILPAFPAWVHRYSIFPVVTGVAMVIVGLIVMGVFNSHEKTKKKLCLWLGVYFFTLIVVSHIPYLLFVYPHKLSHLGSWGDVLKALAFSGASLVMAGSFSQYALPAKTMMDVGRVFFCTTIILFGCNHFVYDISAMVPRWIGMGTFWSYFGGAALITSGVAILFKVFMRPVSLLLAAMLFIWFVILHAPNAIANPHAGNGNEIVSAFDALLFSGTALLLASSVKTNKLSK